MSAYQGEPGGPRDPATPGPYCLTRCHRLEQAKHVLDEHAAAAAS